MEDHTPPEVWFRNPFFYIRECAEQRVDKILWDRGAAVNKRTDPVRHAALHIPPDVEYRLIVAGDQGCAEYRRGDVFDKPRAVYPAWVHGINDIGSLEELLAEPVGDNRALCARLQQQVSGDCAPVYGQEHRVLILNMPSLNNLTGRAFVSVLEDLQRAYPDAIMHIHGVYSYPAMFGRNFGAVDIDPFITARRGRITLPSGKNINLDQLDEYKDWIESLNGWSVAKVRAEARNRCLFNMDSARWAARYYKSNVAINPSARRSKSPPITEAILEAKREPEQSWQRNKPSTSAVRDKVLCEYCSLAPKCHYFREGSVCALPDTDAEKITSMFNTRNPDKILEGLTGLLEVQGKRLERGLELEQDGEGIDGGVTRLMDSMFKQGVQLAKLVAPERFLKPGVSVNVGVAGRNNAVAIGTGPVPMHQLVASAMAALESQGIPREQITNEMIDAYMSGGELQLPSPRDPAEYPPPAAPSAPIDAEVIE